MGSLRTSAHRVWRLRLRSRLHPSTNRSFPNGSARSRPDGGRDLRGSAGNRPHTERASVRECDKHLQPEGDFAYLHKPAGRPPRARHYVRKEDDVALLERFDCAGMLEFALASEIDRRFVAGIFPVAKSATRDRPITNRRPRNAVERSVGASAELLSEPVNFVS